MKIVFINGSPRPDGNTGTILKTVAKKAKDRGAEVTYYEIMGKDIQDCDGCYRCDKEDQCSIDDDMIEAYALIEQADVLVLGSPIYMGSETGITKCFVDRLYFLMTKKRIQPNRRAAAIFTCGLPSGNMVYGNMHGRFDKILNDLGYEEVKTFLVPGMKNVVNVDGNHYAQESIQDLEKFIFSDW